MKTNYCVQDKSWIGIIMKETNAFRQWVAKFCNFSWKWKLLFLLLCDTYDYNIDVYVCKHIELRWNKLFCLWKSWISILKEKMVFRRRQFWSFHGGSVRIKGAKNFVLVSCSFKVYCKLQRLLQWWILEYLVKYFFWLVNQTCQ